MSTTPGMRTAKLLGLILVVYLGLQILLTAVIGLVMVPEAILPQSWLQPTIHHTRPSLRKSRCERW